MNFNALQEVEFLLKCINETDVDRNSFLQRLSDLYDTGMISDYAYHHIGDILGRFDE